jgi:hypothetical protein
MADATITLKLSAAEFDFLREVIARDKANQESVVKDTHVDPATRKEAREQAAISHFLLEKLT